MPKRLSLCYIKGYQINMNSTKINSSSSSSSSSITLCLGLKIFM